jgi:hypothetical protein
LALVVSPLVALAQPAPPAGGPSLDTSVGALVSLLQARNQCPDLTLAQREKALAGLLAGLDLATTPEPAPLPTRVDEPITLNGLYAYVRMRHVGTRLPDVVEGALDDVRDGHYEAAILDLRGTTGRHPCRLGKAFSFLKEDPIPIVCLVDGQTRLAPAQLAAELRATYKAILVGQPPGPTAPAPEAVRLPTGERVWLPVRRPAQTDPPAALRIDLPVRNAQAARITSETAEDWPVLAARDECLRRSVDLLTAMRAFRQP